VGRGQPKHIGLGNNRRKGRVNSANVAHIGRNTFDNLQAHKDLAMHKLNSRVKWEGPWEWIPSLLTFCRMAILMPMLFRSKSNFRLITLIIAALESVIPALTATCMTKNMPATAAALSAPLTEDWITINTAVCAIPVPNPLGMMYSDSRNPVFPCHRRNSKRYENHATIIAIMRSFLYLPVLFVVGGLIS
jgi:hypothetical protein